MPSSPTLVSGSMRARCAHCGASFATKYAYQARNHANGHPVFDSTRCANRWKAAHGIGLRRVTAPTGDLPRRSVPRMLGHAKALRAAELWQTGLLSYAEIARALQLGSERSERGRYYVRKGLALLRVAASTPSRPDAAAS